MSDAMTMNTAYANARPSIQTGDLVAFGGKGHFSNIIKWATRSAVSHVASVLSVGSGEESRVMVIESTSLYGNRGVQVNALSAHIAGYDGEIWWCPLHSLVRDRFDEAAFVAFMTAQIGKRYDFAQAAGSALDWVDRLGLANEIDYDRFFCSELCAAGLIEGGAVPHGNASEVHPADLVAWDVWGAAVQVRGSPLAIPRFGSREPWAA